MVDIQNKAKRLDQRPVGRVAYAPPALKEFGPVGALTQSGTAGPNEMSGKPPPVML